MLKEAKLIMEVFLTEPPKPAGFHILLDGKIVALLSIEEVKKAYDGLNRAEQKRNR